MKKSRAVFLVFLIVSLMFTVGRFDIPPVKASVLYEDFTTFTEEDLPADRIQETSTHVDHKSVRNEATYLWKDYGVDYFENFTHCFDAQVQSFGGPTWLHIPWSLGNTLTHAMALDPMVACRFYVGGEDTRTLYLTERNDSSVYDDTSEEHIWTFDTMYYFKVTKLGTDLKMGVYSTDFLRDRGNASGGDVDNFALTLQFNYKFRYLFACNTWTLASNTDITNGDTEYLYLTQDTEPPKFTNVGTNSTIADQPCLFSTEWNDNVSLSGYIFGSNNTGTWENDTWTPFQTAPPNTTFAKYSGNPVFAVAGKDCPIEEVNYLPDETHPYWLTYSKQYGQEGIGLAYSDTIWGNYIDCGVIITNGASGKFDYYSTYSPFLLSYGDYYYIAYAGENQSGIPRFGGTGLARRLISEGINGAFTKMNDGNPILLRSTDTADFDYFRTSECALTWENNTWYMVYMGHNGTDYLDYDERVGLATTSVADPAEWTNTSFTKYEGNPIIDWDVGTWDEGTCADPFLIQYEGIWYIGYVGGSDNWEEGFAFTDDWVTYTKCANNPVLQRTAGTWDAWHVLRGGITILNNTYYWFYSGREELTDFRGGIAYAFTSVEASDNEWSNVTKTLNATASQIQWQIWANDTANNWNTTGIQTLTIGEEGYTLTLQARDKDGTNIPRQVTFTGTYSNSTSFDEDSDSSGLKILTVPSGTQTVNTWWGSHLVDSSRSVVVTGDQTENINTKIARLTSGSYYILMSVDQTNLLSPSVVGTKDWKLLGISGSGSKQLKVDTSNWIDTNEPEVLTINGNPYETGWTWNGATHLFTYSLDLSGTAVNIMMSWTPLSDGTGPGGTGPSGGTTIVPVTITETEPTEPTEDENGIVSTYLIPQFDEGLKIPSGTIIFAVIGVAVIVLAVCIYFWVENNRSLAKKWNRTPKTKPKWKK